MPPRATILIIITSALVAYTIGVWGERLQGRLRSWHLAFFWFGLVCDTTGTEMMRRSIGGFTFNFHGITGVTALFLMMVHAVWASAVLLRKDERAILGFHRFSTLVWTIWLVPMFSPMIWGLAKFAGI